MKENNELKKEVKKLSNKRSYDDMSGIEFNKSMTKGKEKEKER